MLPGSTLEREQANSRSFLFGLVMLVVFLSLQSVRTRPKCEAAGAFGGRALRAGGMCGPGTCRKAGRSDP
jgi:hypothetical protein